jgi:uncharacterized membrane protein YraQ (UPF0718 family)
VIGYLISGPLVIIDVVLIVVFAYLLQKTKKRMFAYLLLALMLLILAGTVINRIETDGAGGQNIYLAALLIWFSVRSIQATTFLAKESEIKQPVQG